MLNTVISYELFDPYDYNTYNTYNHLYSILIKVEGVYNMTAVTALYLKFVF